MVKNSVLFSIIVLAVVVVDQVTKFLIKTFLVEKIEIIPNFFNLVYITNTGGLFGSFKGGNLSFIFLSLIVIGVILYLYNKLVVDKITAVTYGIILAGVIGNLIDRIFLGFVVDWLDFMFFGWHY